MEIGKGGRLHEKRMDFVECPKRAGEHHKRRTDGTNSMEKLLLVLPDIDSNTHFSHDFLADDT